jgi:regulation of enolase protein 1 (concanavalin A-like superfamily)
VAVNDTSGSLSLNYNLAGFSSLPATGSVVRTAATGNLNLASQPAVTLTNKSFSSTLISDSVTTFILTNVSTLPNQTVLTVSNSGFELPGTGKISSGFATIPGWANAGTSYTDSGVETAPAPHSGSYSAYCKGSDSGAYQIVNYQINVGDTLTLTWWAEHSGGSGSSTQAVSLVSAAALNSAYASTTVLASTNNLLNGYGSSAGPWTQYTLTYQATAGDAGKYIGIYFNNATAANWAGFDDFSLTVVPLPLPSPWATTDIGAVGVAGNATDTNGLFTVSGSGSDIWGGADAFRYVYQPASGDCSIQAKVLSVQNTAPWAKAGVMIRETTNANSTYAIVFLSPVTATSTNGVAFQQRASTGGSASGIANTPGLQAPYWVQLARTGNSFVGSYSANGTNWTPMATNSITMATNVYIGLPVCSVNNSTLNTATFTNAVPTP